MNACNPEGIDTVIVGAGQAGLAAGYHLAQRGREFLIVDAGRRIGEAWRQRWDSLRLFTPAALDGLPGLPFPAAPSELPTKDEMARYLEVYANHFALPVRLETPVTRLFREGERFALVAGGRRLMANQVIVATGAYHHPNVPSFASALDGSIVQLHSSQYRHPGQLQGGPVLVVGAGNSGAEIALELASEHETWLSGRNTGRVPFGFGGRLRRTALWWVLTRVPTTDTILGRALKRWQLGHGDPLIRLRPSDLSGAAVQRLPRVTGVLQGRPVLADGRTVDAANVIWCTGFQPDFHWIELPLFGPDGYPVHDRGVVEREPGICFLGLEFLYSPASSTVGGVGFDAEHIARHLAQGRRSGHSLERCAVTVREADSHVRHFQEVS